MHDYAQNSPPSLVETNFLLTQVPSYCFHRGILIISAALGICPQFNKCIFTKMKVGCLRHPGASTTGSQLLEKNPGNPAMSPHEVRGTGTCHTVETVERGKGRGWEGTAWAVSCHNKIARTMPPEHTPRNDPRAHGAHRYTHLK